MSNISNKKRTKSRRHHKDDSHLDQESTAEQSSGDERTASWHKMEEIRSQMELGNNIMGSVSSAVIDLVKDIKAELLVLEAHLAQEHKRVESLFTAFSSIIEGSIAEKIDQDINRSKVGSDKPSEEGSNDHSEDTSSRKSSSKRKRRADDCDDNSGENSSSRTKKKTRRDSSSPATPPQEAHSDKPQQDGNSSAPVHMTSGQTILDIATNDGDESDDSYYPSSSEESDSDSTSISLVSSPSAYSVLSDYPSSLSDDDETSTYPRYMPSHLKRNGPLQPILAKPLRRDFDSIFDFGDDGLKIFRDHVAMSWYEGARYERNTTMEQDLELVTERTNADFEFTSLP